MLADFLNDISRPTKDRARQSGNHLPYCYYTSWANYFVGYRHRAAMKSYTRQKSMICIYILYFCFLISFVFVTFKQPFRKTQSFQYSTFQMKQLSKRCRESILSQVGGSPRSRVRMLEDREVVYSSLADCTNTSQQVVENIYLFKYFLNSYLSTVTSTFSRLALPYDHQCNLTLT